MNATLYEQLITLLLLGNQLGSPVKYVSVEEREVSVIYLFILNLFGLLHGDAVSMVPGTQATE